jgi:hypothetical protein
VRKKFTLWYFPLRGTVLKRQTNKVGHAEPGSVALPGIMRAGGPGATQFDVGQMQAAQFGTVSGQAKSGHQAPMVSSSKRNILFSIEPTIACKSQIRLFFRRVPSRRSTSQVMPNKHSLVM